MHSLRCARRLPAAIANAPQRATALSRISPPHSIPPAPAPAAAAAATLRSHPLAAFSTSTRRHRSATADYDDEMNPSDPGGDFVYRSKNRFDEYQAHPSGTIRLHQRKALPPEEAKRLYREFKPHRAVITPGPTDPPGHAPQEVTILWRQSSPPERMIDSLSRLCYSPSYRVAKQPEKDTVMSTELEGVQLAFGSPVLPREARPMKRSHKEWSIGRGGTSLEKAFRFASNEQALRFMHGLHFIMKIKIGKGDFVDHHAELAFAGRRVFVRWGTHDPQLGISSWDVYCAKRTDFWAVRCQVRDVVPETATWRMECDVPRGGKAALTVDKKAEAVDKKATDAAVSPCAPSGASSSSLPDSLAPAIHRLVQVQNTLLSGESRGMSAGELASVKRDLLEASGDLQQFAKTMDTVSTMWIERHRKQGVAVLESALETKGAGISEAQLELEDIVMEESVEKPAVIIKGNAWESREREAADEDETKR